MTEDEILNIFRQHSALLEGHFVLSSGLHSDRYIQSALALRNPADAEALGAAVAAKCAGAGATLVAGPALGGMIIAHEVARALRVPMIFTERDPDTRRMSLRRGFAAGPADRVVMVEDVVTTGGSVAEAGAVVAATGATIVGYACIVDRSGGKPLPWNSPLASLAKLDLPAWKPEACPLCASGSKAVKPGSRPASART
jgi:orotate phosphoribosyltransferase